MTKTTTVLYVSMLLVVAVIIPTSAIATESLYDQLFPDTDVPADIKSQIESNLNTDAIDMPLPANQETVSRTAGDLLKQIEDATDPSVKEQLQSKLNSMISEMLKAGVVPRHLYEENPEMWDNLLESFRQQEVDDKVTNVSHQSYDWRVGAQYKYWCQNGLLVCMSSWMNYNSNSGDLKSFPSVTLPSHAYPGWLSAYQSTQYKGGHPPVNEVTTDSWVSIKSGNSWVDSCYDDNLWNFGYNNKKNTWTVCTSTESDSGNKVYASIRVTE